MRFGMVCPRDPCGTTTREFPGRGDDGRHAKVDLETPLGGTYASEQVTAPRTLIGDCEQDHMQLSGIVQRLRLGSITFDPRGAQCRKPPRDLWDELVKPFTKSSLRHKRGESDAGLRGPADVEECTAHGLAPPRCLP